MVQDCLCHLAVIFLCADTALNRILQEFDRQGMMTSEYVYIMPVMNMVTYEVSPQLRRYYEHIRLVRDGFEHSAINYIVRRYYMFSMTHFYPTDELVSGLASD